jgi:serine protease DegS
LVIENLDADGPGAKAGLQRGDVLMQLNNKPVAGVRSAMDMIAEAKPGTKISVVVLRKGKSIQMNVIVEEDLRFKNFTQ